MKRRRVKYGPTGGSHVPGRQPGQQSVPEPEPSKSYGVQPGQYGQQDGGQEPAEPGGDLGQMGGGGLNDNVTQEDGRLPAGGYGTQRLPERSQYEHPQPLAKRAEPSPYEHPQYPASDSGDCRFGELPAGVPQKWGQRDQHPRSASGGCQFGQEHDGPIVWGQHSQHPLLLP